MTVTLPRSAVERVNRWVDAGLILASTPLELFRRRLPPHAYTEVVASEPGFDPNSRPLPCTASRPLARRPPHPTRTRPRSSASAARFRICFAMALLTYGRVRARRPGLSQYGR